ncbi:MAG: hypothetical protein ACI8VW_002470, partial [bacterium]
MKKHRPISQRTTLLLATLLTLTGAFASEGTD